MKFIDEADIHDKKVLLRVDFNVSFLSDHSIADDARIRQSIPTIEYLLQKHNKLILIAHLGEPTQRDEKYSLRAIIDKLHSFLTAYEIVFVDDFLTSPDAIKNQTENQVVLLENIRFYPGEVKNDLEFAKQLAALGDVYVNDAFSVSHRAAASIVGLPGLLPSFGGLLLKKEVTTIGNAISHPNKPFVAIIGGAKVSTKLPLLFKLTEIADYLLLGGGIANTFLLRLGYQMGKSLVETGQEANIDNILAHAKEKQTHIVLPEDAMGAMDATSQSVSSFSVKEVPSDRGIFDIGPLTQAIFGNIISGGQTIIWNGPVGYMENPVFKRGTDFLYYAITQNDHALSIVGGGDTLAAISQKEYLDKITHISTGGGAMLEFVENGTLPGIEALKQNTITLKNA